MHEEDHAIVATWLCRPPKAPAFASHTHRDAAAAFQLARKKKWPIDKPVSRLPLQVPDVSNETMGSCGFEGFEHGSKSPGQMGGVITFHERFFGGRSTV
jgi:hypothetical protein